MFPYDKYNQFTLEGKGKREGGRARERERERERTQKEAKPNTEDNQ